MLKPKAHGGRFVREHSKIEEALGWIAFGLFVIIFVGLYVLKVKEAFLD